MPGSCTRGVGAPVLCPRSWDSPGADLGRQVFQRGSWDRGCSRAPDGSGSETQGQNYLCTWSSPAQLPFYLRII